MHLFVSSYSEAYSQLRRIFLTQAIETKPRKMLIKELLNVSVTLDNPRNRIAYHADRKYNLQFNIAELIAIINGINSVKFLTYFNKNVKQFSDNGIDFYGAYGPRLDDQWGRLIDTLVRDNDTRQAVMTIYDGQSDLNENTKDIPCTLNLHFMIRNNKLNLTTYMRSNDLFWGFQYDIFNFTMIQEMVFSELEMLIPNLKLGTYTHNATSLHVYEKHFKLLKQIEEMEPVKMPNISLLKDDYDKLCEFICETIENNTFEYKNLNNVNFKAILAKYFMNKLKVKSSIDIGIDDWAEKFLI